MTDERAGEAARNVLKVDVEFAATGGPVAVDHGYPLFGALSRVLGDLHGADWLAVHPLRGTPLGAGKLAIGRAGPPLVLRVHHDRIPDVLRLSGKTLEVARAKIHVGVSQLRMLRSVSSLVARMVVFKHHLTPETFLTHVIEDLARLGVRADVALGRRRIVTIAGDRVVGFGLALHGLSEDDSMRLQRDGLGGRRHFGCGVFVPAHVDADATRSSRKAAP